MKLLLLTYHFPPTGGVGVQRVIKLLKYLPENDITPVVVTAANNISTAYDPELLELEEVEKCKVYRIGGQKLEPFLSRRVAGDKKTVGDYVLGLSSLPFIDVYQKWSRVIGKQVEKIIQIEDIDCIYSTSPPHSVHFLGSHLRHFTGKPWIMELRDSMTDWPLRKAGVLNSISKQMERVYEKRFYKIANGVIFVADGQLKNAESRVSELSQKPTLVVPNGYDPADYPKSSGKVKPEKTFDITFTGNLTDHDISIFCKAISHLSESSDLGHTTIRLKIVGIVDGRIRKTLNSLPSTVQVDLVGFVSHKEAIKHQMESHCLLLLQTSDTGAKGGEMINAKLFEYLATRLPIVAITPKGQQWNIIKDSKLGIPALPQDINAIKEAIRFSYNLAISDCFDVNSSIINSFSREKQIRTIANFIRARINDTQHSNRALI